MSISKSDLAKLNAMKQYGGSFAALIAEAWMHADASNQVKLEVFRDMLDDYAAFVKDGCTCGEAYGKRTSGPKCTYCAKGA